MIADQRELDLYRIGSEKAKRKFENNRRYFPFSLTKWPQPARMVASKRPSAIVKSALQQIVGFSAAHH